MKLSVVIVNYNVKHFLEQCLYSVCRAAEKVQSAEVIVVDNASSDGSVEYISNRFPDIRLIASNENLGFARANNLAMRESKGEYVLLLNPDTIVAETTFLHFVDFMDKHPDAGACGAYMLHTDGTFALESRRGLPTPFVAFCKMSGLTSLFPKSKIFGRYYMRYLNETKVNPIEIVSGAFMFMRREALDKVGLLDENFFMYGEDIDLSYRILKGGYRNYFIPSPILHYKGESTKKSSYRYTHTFYQAMQLFFKKHYSHYSVLVSFPIRLAIWVRAMFAYIGNQFRYRGNLKRMRCNCIVIGSETSLKEMSEILSRSYAKEKHLYVQGDEASMPMGHLSGGIDFEGYNTIVYDCEAYSYETILNLMHQSPFKDMRLGTYSPKTKKFITERFVHELV